MAKDEDDKAAADAKKAVAEAAAKVAADEKARADEKATADAQAKAESDKKAKSLEGLVKMHRNGDMIHAHPTTIKDHEKNGWKIA